MLRIKLLLIAEQFIMFFTNNKAPWHSEERARCKVKASKVDMMIDIFLRAKLYVVIRLNVKTPSIMPE
jgi:hypothetical protein